MLLLLEPTTTLVLPIIKLFLAVVATAAASLVAPLHLGRVVCTFGHCRRQGCSSYSCHSLVALAFDAEPGVGDFVLVDIGTLDVDPGQTSGTLDHGSPGKGFIAVTSDNLIFFCLLYTSPSPRD